ncbi:MAG: hypothetical protein GY694_00715 [Gammaproteobacteria bacterium]|nr:hypothetical protein [Gammaproteobacteria bacterium]
MHQALTTTLTTVVALAIMIAFFPLRLNAADFNIKLRKTDINELKQQLMPRFEQNIDYLNTLLVCLENGKSVDTCLEDYSIALKNNKKINTQEKEQRSAEIKAAVENKINEKDISSEQMISELKKLLQEAESVKLCLIKGQTANELKDCIVSH